VIILHYNSLAQMAIEITKYIILTSNKTLCQLKLQKTDSNPSTDKLTNLGTCHIKIRPATKIIIPLYSVISPTQQHGKIQEEKHANQ
jgi:hypothetical protein